MLLLFAGGERPDECAMRSAVQAAGSLSVVHVLPRARDGSASGFELLSDGMTFDLTGLAPGAAVRTPALRHRYGFESASGPARYEAVGLAPGPHLVAGARMLPVVRSLAGLVASLIPGLPQLCALAWPPAGTLIGPGFFASSVASWLSGGAFPALGLTAFAEDSDGTLRSEGLAWFTGQEVSLSPELAKDRAAAARLGMRLINQLVAHGRIEDDDVVVGPDGGRLALIPTRDASVVRVRRG